MKERRIYFFKSLSASCSVLIFYVLLLPPLFGIDGESGRYYTDHYAPKAYRAHSQNWALIQDSKGYLYFGNGGGVLVFNGLHWQLIPLPNLNLVRSLAIDEFETIYAGGYDELGYLEKDVSGNMKYLSLVSGLSDEHKKFGNVWKIHALGKTVVFVTDKGLFIWENERFNLLLWDSVEGYRRSFLLDNELWVFREGNGLSKLISGNLEPHIGGDFYKYKKIFGILPYLENQWLICTADDGFFLYNGSTSTVFKTDADNFLRNNQIYSAIKLDSNYYALGTLTGGIVLIDKKGKMVDLINKATGLGDNAIYNMGLDFQGGLWATHSFGITRIEWQTPITIFDDRSGLEGAVNDLIRYEGDFYAATMLGLYKLNPAVFPETSAYFEKINEIHSSVWSMINVDNSLIFTTDYGTHELKNENFSQIDNFSGTGLIRYKTDSSRIFIALANGLVVLKQHLGKWMPEGRVNGITADVVEIKEDKAGNIWLGTFSEGVFRLTFQGTSRQRDYLNPEIVHYGNENKLPNGLVRLYVFNGNILFKFTDTSEIYRFDADRNTFYKDHSFVSLLGSDASVVMPMTDEVHGIIWMTVRKNGDEGWGRYRLAIGSHGVVWEQVEVSMILEDAEVVFYEEDEISWYGGLEGVVRHEFRRKTADSPFKTNVTRVTIGNDSTIYRGGVETVSFDLPYRFNTLKFEYAASFYDAPGETEYQYILDGFE